MKIIKTASGKRSIKLSKSEWQSIGKKAGWTRQALEEGSWLSAVGPCDICKTDLKDEDVFYDAAVGKTNGPWGLMCQKCFDMHGVGVGDGMGQKYDAKTRKKLASSEKESKMKIKTASGKKTIKISKNEWKSIGKKAGWIKESDDEDLESHFDHYQRGRSDKPMFVSLYETERAYGGPEEGGWWYDINEVKSSQKFFDRDEAEAFLQTIRAKIEAQGLNDEDLSSSRGMDGYIDPSNGDPMHDHSDDDIPLGFSGDARNYWATIEETQGENETTETPHYE